MLQLNPTSDLASVDAECCPLKVVKEQLDTTLAVSVVPIVR